MKVSIVQPDLDIGNTYSFEFLSSAETLDVDSRQHSIDGMIACAGTIVNTGTCYRVEGTVRLAQTFACDRCLETFSEAQIFPFSEDYQQSEATKDEGETVSFSGDFIDITELVRETILLSQPLQHICKSDCRGLCLKCGANLNEAECGCDRQIIDPRLAALQKLLDKK